MALKDLVEAVDRARALTNVGSKAVRCNMPCWGHRIPSEFAKTDWKMADTSSMDVPEKFMTRCILCDLICLTNEAKEVIKKFESI